MEGESISTPSFTRQPMAELPIMIGGDEPRKTCNPGLGFIRYSNVSTAPEPWPLLVLIRFNTIAWEHLEKVHFLTSLGWIEVGSEKLQF
jgi:hypothetical protein